MTKARGVKLGIRMRGCAQAGREGWCRAAPDRRAIADPHAADLAPVVADIRAAGHLTLRAAAAEPSQRGMLARQGWAVACDECASQGC